MQSVIFSVLSADLQENSQRGVHRQLQRDMMNFLIRRSNGDAIDFQNSKFVRSKDVDWNDECRWRGVDCTDGVMHTFITNEGVLGDDEVLNMRWLPSTLRFFHLQFVWLQAPWKAAELPRELRYFYSYNCYLYMEEYWLVERQERKDQKRHDLFVDLRKLPRRLEEFRLNSGFWAGPVRLANLPETLRLLHLTKILVYPTVVDNASLPEGLKSIIIDYCEGSKNQKLISTDGAPVDNRVKLQMVAHAFRNNSEYYNFCMDRSAEIHQQVTQEARDNEDDA